MGAPEPLTEALAGRICAATSLADGSLHGSDVAVHDGAVFATVRAIERDESGAIASIREQRVLLASAWALSDPDRLCAYLTASAKASPARLSRGEPADAFESDLLAIAAARTEQDFTALLADPALPTRLGRGPMTVAALADLSGTEPVARSPELEAAIVRAQASGADDLASHLVYADWLMAHGDPRGAVIVGQAPGASPAAAQTADELRVAHHRYLYGPLTFGDPALEVTQRLGWLHTARVSLAVDAYDVGTPWVRGVLGALLRLPSARFLRHLTVGALGHGFTEGTRYETLLPLFEDGGPRDALRTLVLGDVEREEQEISWLQVGDVGPLLALLPELRELRLRGGDIGLGDLPCPHLASLVLETVGLPRQPVVALQRASLPALHTLELWGGRSAFGAECDVEDLLPLLDGRLPALRRLGLRNFECTDALAAELVRSPALAQLEALDLSLGTLTDAGAAVLAASRDRLAHLQRLDVSESQLTARGIAALDGVCSEVVAADQRPSDGGLFVAVGE